MNGRIAWINNAKAFSMIGVYLLHTIAFSARQAGVGTASCGGG